METQQITLEEIREDVLKVAPTKEPALYDHNLMKSILTLGDLSINEQKLLYNEQVKNTLQEILHRIKDYCLSEPQFFVAQLVRLFGRIMERIPFARRDFLEQVGEHPHISGILSLIILNEGMIKLRVDFLPYLASSIEAKKWRASITQSLLECRDQGKIHTLHKTKSRLTPKDQMFIATDVALYSKEIQNVFFLGEV